MLAGATERPGFAAGLDAGVAAGLPPLGVPVQGDLSLALQAGADVVVDFTSFEASVAHAAVCAEAGVASSSVDRLHARGAGPGGGGGARIPIVLSPNMSVGVNVLFAMVRQAALALGDAYDVEIVELHHKKKKDAPSGTAMRLAEVAAEALGRDPARDHNFGRHGLVGERPTRTSACRPSAAATWWASTPSTSSAKASGCSSPTAPPPRRVRAGGGSGRAWLVGRPPGLHDMADVLGLGERLDADLPVPAAPGASTTASSRPRPLRALTAEPWAGGLPEGPAHPLAEVALLAPVQPSKVVYIGRTDGAHARELGHEVPKEPLLFIKPSTSVVGPGDEIRLPAASQEVHHEAELAVVIGPRAERRHRRRRAGGGLRLHLPRRRHRARHPGGGIILHARQVLRHLLPHRAMD